MDALDAIRRKRDTRTFIDREVDDETLEQILDAARMGGSAKNRQPIRIVAVRDDATKQALTEAGDFASWIPDAPVVCVFAVRAELLPRGLFDVGRHAQNLMVAAKALGLGSCPVTLHHEDVARAALGIPDDMSVQFLVALGWPQPGEKAPEVIAGPRLDLDTYAFRERWSADVS